MPPKNRTCLPQDDESIFNVPRDIQQRVLDAAVKRAPHTKKADGYSYNKKPRDRNAGASELFGNLFSQMGGSRSEQNSRPKK